SELEHTRFRDLKDPIPGMVADLTSKLPDRNTGTPRRRVFKLQNDDFCHLDPDIDILAFRHGRPEGWRGALGQIGKSQGHLEKSGVGPGDLFLFWGLFQPVAE